MFSIRNLMLWSNVAIGAAFVCLLTVLVSREWRDFKTLERASEATSVVSALSSANIELSLERSLTPWRSTLIRPSRQTSRPC